MARYIDGVQCAETLSERLDISLQSLVDAFVEIPTADVVEVKHGKWKECFEDWRKQIAGDECSVCGFQHYGISMAHYNYCPNCGARMDGKEK